MSFKLRSLMVRLQLPAKSFVGAGMGTERKVAPDLIAKYGWKWEDVHCGE